VLVAVLIGASPAPGAPDLPYGDLVTATHTLLAKAPANFVGILGAGSEHNDALSYKSSKPGSLPSSINFSGFDSYAMGDDPEVLSAKIDAWIPSGDPDIASDKLTNLLAPSFAGWTRSKAKTGVKWTRGDIEVSTNVFVDQYVHQGRLYAFIEVRRSLKKPLHVARFSHGITSKDQTEILDAMAKFLDDAAATANSNFEMMRGKQITEHNFVCVDRYGSIIGNCHISAAIFDGSSTLDSKWIATFEAPAIGGDSTAFAAAIEAMFKQHVPAGSTPAEPKQLVLTSSASTTPTATSIPCWNCPGIAAPSIA